MLVLFVVFLLVAAVSWGIVFWSDKSWPLGEFIVGYGSLIAAGITLVVWALLKVTEHISIVWKG